MENLFTAVKRESAVDIVINNIKQLLIDRRLLPGDKLPSELEISEGLDVSRGSVREAMKILSAFGLVDIKVGNGTYVCESPGHGLIDSLLFSFFITNPNIESLYEFRQFFEIDILELILNHYDKILENDIEFHRLLASACCNPMVEKIYNFIMDSLRASISNTHRHQNGEYVLNAHQSIYEIIREKDYQGIESCIKKSIDIWYKLQD